MRNKIAIEHSFLGFEQKSSSVVSCSFTWRVWKESSTTQGQQKSAPSCCELHTRPPAVGTPVWRCLMPQPRRARANSDVWLGQHYGVWSMWEGHLAVDQNQWYHFGVGAQPMLVYFSGDWDVHWGCGISTHGHMAIPCSQEASLPRSAALRCRMQGLRPLRDGFAEGLDVNWGAL